MMKISHEVKVGIIALVTLVAFIWLFNFLKGKDLFRSTTYYYTVYDRIGGLAESSPVEINGYKVGIVQSIDFIDETSGRLLVAFSVNKGFRLPENTVAEITPVSIIAGMKVQFVFGNGPGFYSHGDTIPGRLAESLLTSFESEFAPLKDKITDLLGSLDSVISSINEVMNDEFKNDLTGTLGNIRSTTKSFDNILGSREAELKATLDNISEFSGMLSDNSEALGGSFRNLRSITDTLASADIYNSALNLKTSLEKASLLLENLNEGKGSAGQILSDESLYNNLTGTLSSLDKLLADMKENPKRYVHFSLFGRKNVPAQ